MTERILVPVDLAQQEAAATALAKARKINPEASITLLHILPRIPEYYATHIPEEVLQSHPANARQELRDFASKNGLGEKDQIVLRSGTAGREILNFAGDNQIDLIAIASHDPGLADFLLGSVAAFVVRHAHCSVLVVRSPGA